MLIKIDHHKIYKSNYRGRDAKSTSSGFSQKNTTRENSINFNKPLSESVETQVSFKGFNFSKMFSPTIETVPQKLVKHALDMLEDMSDGQKQLYSKYINDFINLAQMDTVFRKRIGLNEKIANDLSPDNIIQIPRKNILIKLASTLVSPITALKDMAQRALYNPFVKSKMPKIYAYLEKLKNDNAVIENYKKVLGLTDFIEIKETQYRNTAGHGKWEPKHSFMMPKELIESNIKLMRMGTVNPEKGQYSSKDVMLGNRFVSGSIYAAFLANDAYNTTMKYSNDEKASKEQSRSRIKQEVAKIALNMYIYNVLLSVFERKINKNLFNALLMGGITVASAEILGRMLVGRPIFPSDKESLDRMDAEMQNKKGLLPTIGRMISSGKGVKSANKPCAPAKETNKNTPQQQITPNQSKSFTAFAPKTIQAQQNVSFKGKMPKLPLFFEVQKLKSILNIIKQSDLKQFNEIEKIVLRNLSQYKDNELGITAQTSIMELLSQDTIKAIPVGEANTFADKFIKGITAPYHFIKDTTIALNKLIKNIYHQIAGDKLDYLRKQNLELVKELKLGSEYEDYLKKRLSEEAWGTSPHSQEQIECGILAEFLKCREKQSKEVDGVKNILLVLERKFKQKNIDTNKPSAEDLEKAKKILDDLLTKADNTNHAKYDANTLAQANINIARAITTIFLITDAYNLAIQYSNNNKHEAVKSAKSRTVQEVSRVATSAYIMAFFHSILSRLCNGSLLGAWITTMITSVTSDSLARGVVGVPISRKSQQELLEIDKKNENSNNPVRKLLAYLIGKRTS